MYPTTNKPVQTTCLQNYSGVTEIRTGWMLLPARTEDSDRLSPVQDANNGRN